MNDIDPQAIRMVFAKNLKTLTQRHTDGNVTKFAKQIGCNRTQFNRYLTGESWPRPDVLARICVATGTDARIVTTPLDEIETATVRILTALKTAAEELETAYPALGFPPEMDATKAIIDGAITELEEM